jgi:hypothetical protein
MLLKALIGTAGSNGINTGSVKRNTFASGEIETRVKTIYE